MFGRRIFGLLAVIALVALVAVIGTSVYNAGVSQGLTDAAISAASSGDPAPVVVAPYGGQYGYGHGGWGFGFFGIFFWILGFFLIFGLLRAPSAGADGVAAVRAAAAGNRARSGCRNSTASFIGEMTRHPDPAGDDEGRAALDGVAPPFVG